MSTEGLRKLKRVGFGVGCGFGVGWGFGGMPLNTLGLGVGGGCGVGLGLGWGFGTAFGSQYRSARVTFQGMDFNSSGQDWVAYKELGPFCLKVGQPVLARSDQSLRAAL
ncbi:hypothetical protein L1049_025535 [Liquidambar formosana]|uniref:Uncharacterized protein n=1 Tax=Liquidambar formosana TaxID=63359 RepID=A0AAP0ND21_LIQFO